MNKRGRVEFNGVPCWLPSLGKPQKTVFFSGPATEALPPLELSGHNIFRASKNVLFISGQALTPPLS